MKSCEDCKYFNIDDKDGAMSTCYPFCELDVRTPQEMTTNTKRCDKFKSFMRCNCPYGRQLNKEWHESLED